MFPLVFAIIELKIRLVTWQLNQRINAVGAQQSSARYEGLFTALGSISRKVFPDSKQFTVNNKETKITWEICKSKSMTFLFDLNKFD